VRNLLQRGELWRIQERDSESSAKDDIGSCPARAAHTTSHSRHALFCPQHTSNRCRNLFVYEWRNGDTLSTPRAKKWFSHTPGGLTGTGGHARK
jgi:hypothetical protein